MKLNLNQIYITHKSTSCFSRDGNPLSEYKTYDEALESANYINKDLVPYQCSRCGKYHLKPKAFYCEKMQRACSCCDHNGNPKDTYKTYSDAIKMANIRSRDGISLNVYGCPSGTGYHLTSHSI